mmetsp:Transcript_21487/g.47676  ORF Transcript_21487/g.47676 Transcript_21487/m.47676 type:complete len:222 (-) Transcript_21487:79-744(-)
MQQHLVNRRSATSPVFMLLVFLGMSLSRRLTFASLPSSSIRGVHRTTSRCGPGASRNRAVAPVAALPLEIVEPSFNLAGGCLGLGVLLGVKGSPVKNGLFAIAAAVFGLFIAFQTFNLRFAFDSEAFELRFANGAGPDQNAVVGGINRWSYKSFVNWDFLPSKDFPILVYFKETQTPAADRQEAPDFLVPDSLDGQAHFFPAIADAAALDRGFAEHGCTKA